MRVATIDIGTNTVLLLVAERRADHGDGELVAVEERATITRLGEGVDRTRTLSEAAIARTAACLEDYARTIAAARVDRVAVVGTSAMRDATGGERIRAAAKELLGVEAQVIAGEEEARLTFLGALSGLRAATAADGSALVFDIGGGSTEIVRGVPRSAGSPARVLSARSVDVGSVRMTERHVHTDPPTPAELDAIARDVRGALGAMEPLPHGSVPIGIAGTMTTLAAVALEMETYDGARVHGRRMARSDLAATVARLAGLPIEARRAVPGVHPKRADVIVAGGILALELLEAMGADEVQISDRGVRWGLAEELAARA